MAHRHLHRKCTTTKGCRIINSSFRTIIKHCEMTEASGSEPKPKLVVFDLDYTLWPFFADAGVNPPFRKNISGQVVDAKNRILKPYPGVKAILKQLRNEGYVIGIASRSRELQGANRLLELYDWDKYITYKEIYPGSKAKHFAQIKKDSGVEYSEMLFFDDDAHTNKYDMDRIGVLMIIVRNGVDKDLIKKGLAEYAKVRS